MANPSLEVAGLARSRFKNFGLPVWLILTCVVSFSILLGAGAAISNYAPPHPAIAQSPQQEVIFTAADVENGQVTYLGRGGQHGGSVWGHGSYLASIGTWYARSAEVIGSPWMQWTVWLRIPGDIVFTLGAISMVLFTVRAVYSVFQQPTQLAAPEPVRPVVEIN